MKMLESTAVMHICMLEKTHPICKKAFDSFWQSPVRRREEHERYCIQIMKNGPVHYTCMETPLSLFYRWKSWTAFHFLIYFGDYDCDGWPHGFWRGLKMYKLLHRVGIPVSCYTMSLDVSNLTRMFHL